jgi:hypothetical protein
VKKKENKYQIQFLALLKSLFHSRHVKAQQQKSTVCPVLSAGMGPFLKEKKKVPNFNKLHLGCKH